MNGDRKVVGDRPQHICLNQIEDILKEGHVKSTKTKRYSKTDAIGGKGCGRSAASSVS